MAMRKAAGGDVQVQTIRAAVLRRRGGPLSIETLEMEGPRDGEVLVRITASGICHTDISYVNEWYDASEGPLILGHEGAGIVERAGKNVKGFRRGDHVVLSYQSCGTCGACRSGRPADCRDLYGLNFGFRRPGGGNAYLRSGVKGHFFGQSSFATHTLATVRNLVKVKKDLPLELLDEARVALGFKSKTDTVVLALRELVRRRRLDELKALMGRVELDVDVARNRRRPAGPATAKPKGHA